MKISFKQKIQKIVDRQSAKVEDRMALWDSGLSIREIAQKLKITPVAVTAYIGKYRKIHKSIFPYRNKKIWTIQAARLHAAQKSLV